MTPIDATPTSVLFDLAKRHCGVSHQGAGGLAAVGPPALRRAQPPEPPGRFVPGCRGSSCTRRLERSQIATSATTPSARSRFAARMKSLSKRALTGEAILDIVCGEAGRAMDDALKACGQSPTLYRNMMERIACEGSLTADERAEVALVLLVTAACTADVRRAVAEARTFSEKMHGGGLATPPLVPMPQGAGRTAALTGADDRPRWLGLLRIVDGVVAGAPHVGGTHSDGCRGGGARANGRGRKRSRPRGVRPPCAPLARRCGRVVGRRMRFPSRHDARERSYRRGDGGGAAPRPARWLASLSRARGTGRPALPRRLHHLPPHRRLPGVSNECDRTVLIHSAISGYSLFHLSI